MNGVIVSLAISAFAATVAYFFSLVNAHSQRRREKNNITRALLTEVHAMNVVVGLRFDFWKSVKCETRLPPLVLVATDVYDHHVDKIGILDKDVTQDIVEFYGYIRFINEFQKTKDEYENSGLRQEFYARYCKTLSEQLAKRGDKVFSKYYERYELSWPAHCSIDIVLT